MSTTYELKHISGDPYSDIARILLKWHTLSSYHNNQTHSLTIIIMLYILYYVLYFMTNKVVLEIKTENNFTNLTFLKKEIMFVGHQDVTIYSQSWWYICLGDIYSHVKHGKIDNSLSSVCCIKIHMCHDTGTCIILWSDAIWHNAHNHKKEDMRWLNIFQGIIFMIMCSRMYHIDQLIVFLFCI